ncbi:MAG: helix-turn-helix domain-containing protein [Clostridium sp.]|uniref:helix-turn-helix domain-containing protein n=1 Tax=Clostridium sp. TaxID=1506 RepID=UPI003EE78131
MSKLNKKTIFNTQFENIVETSLSLYSETTGDKIKLVRIQSGLNYNSFAKALKISTTTLNKYERNLRIPNKEFLLNIIDTFHIDKNFLIK